jgi:predicted Zn-dependent protease with MMP-like domain
MARFERLVAQALDRLPGRFRRCLDNIEVVVEESPPPEIANRYPGLLLGLYHGVPLTQRSTMSFQMPDLIYLYKGNIERVCATEAQIRRQIRATVLHEVGHHFGLDEQELRNV